MSFLQENNEINEILPLNKVIIKSELFTLKQEYN